VTWRIVLTPTARRMLEAVRDRRVRRLLARRIDSLAHDPEKQGKPLTGELSTVRSLRAVGQRYRILYRVEEERVVVLVLALALRKEGDRRDVHELARKLLRLRLHDPETDR
jgi:mRNA interferase RelE/StbE